MFQNSCGAYRRLQLTVMSDTPSLGHEYPDSDSDESRQHKNADVEDVPSAQQKYKESCDPNYSYHCRLSDGHSIRECSRCYPGSARKRAD